MNTLLKNVHKKCVVGILLCYGMLQFGYSQTQQVNIEAKDITLNQLLSEIRKQTGFDFVFTSSKLNFNRQVSPKFKDVPLTTVLNSFFNANEGVVYVFRNKTIVFMDEDKAEYRTIQGRILSKSTQQPVPGATVSIRDNKITTRSDAKGAFSMRIPEYAQVIEVRILGYEPENTPLTGSPQYTISLDEKTEGINEVVVTGMFTKNKESFTGSVKSLTIDEIKSVSNTNLIAAISMLTPGMRLVENNKNGSSPNSLPEIVVRGNSSLSQSSETTPNQPLIILDGIEITLRDLYDIDINEIERVDILKDASASAVYGERAANGVIVIERKRVTNDKIRLSYSLDGSIDIPDLSSYNYLHAGEKLEFERLAGLYNFELLGDLEDYNRKKLLISKGIDTDWMSRPLRTGFNLGNSLGFSGRSNTVTYRLNLNSRTTNGVMKED